MERAIGTDEFHRAKVKLRSKWTIAETANELNRSHGSIVEDLMLASWLKGPHQKQLERFTCMKDAIAFVRLKRKELRYG